MKTETKKIIKKWVRDYEKTQPGNVMFDEDSFDGSAYFIFKQLLSEEKK